MKASRKFQIISGPKKCTLQPYMQIFKKSSMMKMIVKAHSSQVQNTWPRATSVLTTIASAFSMITMLMKGLMQPESFDSRRGIAWVPSEV